jgi:hypothetical protein
MLAGIDAGIASFARSGVRLMIRFIYNFGPCCAATDAAIATDAPISVILTHIDQLAPILLKNRDLIFALEAGFIGTWGEWHHSTNGNDSVNAHKQILDKELFHFKGVFPVLVRAPALDPISWTRSERWIRCPAWITASRPAAAGEGSLTSSKSRRCDWC